MGKRLYPSSVVSGLLVVFLVAGGCSLEAPEAPRFDTTIYIPLEEERYEGQDMADGLEAVYGDVDNPGPLTIRVTQDLDPVYVEDHLAIEVAGASFQPALDEINFDPPRVAPVSLLMVDMFPETDLAVPIPESSFAPDPTDLGTFASYTRITIASGAMELSLTNNLPVPIGGSGTQAVSIILEDLSTPTPTVVASWEVASELAPGATYAASKDLSGKTVGNHLQLRVTGWSAGSGGLPVTIDPSQSLDMDLAFGNLELSSLTGKLPALTTEVEATFDLGEKISVQSAVIATGQLRWQLQSFLPVDAQLTLEAPQITRNETPLRAARMLPANGSAELVLDLAAARMDLGGSETLTWTIAIVTEATSEPMFVELGTAISAVLEATEISFESLIGVIDHVSGEIDPVAADLDFPEGTEGAEFVAAELTVVVYNRAAVAMEAALELWGAVDGDTSRVLFTAPIAPALGADPESTIVRLNETNSTILDLINLRPESIWVSGSMTIGDGQSTAEVHRDDYIDGRFTLEVPVRLVLETARQEGDPFEIELEEDIREQISVNLLAVSVAASVENHFPTGVEIKLHFARSEGALFVNDDLVLVSDAILPATVDPATGRVTAAVTSEVQLEVTDHEEIQLFTEEILYGAIEATLVGDGENPVEIWSTDYVQVRGMVSLRYRVD